MPSSEPDSPPIAAEHSNPGVSAAESANVDTTAEQPNANVMGAATDESHADVASKEPDIWSGPPDRLETLITALVVAGCALFVFWQVQPNLIFTNTTPTGGDLGAHVWGPAFLRDELLPRFRLTGWTPDWYSGFPAFQFYMVLPSLAIVILDVGLHPLISAPIVAAIGYVAVRGWTVEADRRFAVPATIALAVLAPLLISIPYNIAFKLVTVSGIVLFPVGAWALGHLGGLRFPGPAVLAIASLAFAFDRSFNIYGGNIASTMAGEFAASISLTLSLVALGYVIRGTRTGRDRGKAAVFIALTGLFHLLPAFFLLAATFVVVLVRLGQRRPSAVGWLAVSGTLAALLSAFWVLPFYARTAFLNDMGWERIQIIHSPLVTRSQLNPSEVLSDYPPLPVILLIAFVGTVLSVRNRLVLGYVLTGTAVLMAAGFVWFPEGRLWNARILPFYYLSATLLAGVGVTLAVMSIARIRVGARAAWVVGAAMLLFIPAIRDAWVWPEPGDDGYLQPAAFYALRVYATASLLLLVLTEVPRQLSRYAGKVWIVGGVAALAVIAVSPTRDVGLSSLSSPTGLFWALVLFAAVAAIVALFAQVLRATTQDVDFSRISPRATPPADAADIGVLVPDVVPGNEREAGALEFAETADIPLLAEQPQTAPRIRSEDPRSVLRVAPLAAGAVMFVLLGLALNVVGGVTSTPEDGRSWSFAGVDVTSDDNSFVPGWARWNFAGLQAKTLNESAPGDVGQGGWLEYQYVQRTMKGVGEEIGCGRALWEFAPELNRYGTTMAMMLLPLWTDGCIASMEGLYFEATPTVPYHFLAQSELSAPARTVGVSESVGGPSRAMRDLPYSDFNLERGVDWLHELGVRYYLAFSPRTITAAREHPELTEIASAAPWVIFETEASLVEPLADEPVVIDGVRDHQDEWLDVGVDWFTAWGTVRPASSGPDNWARIDADRVLERYDASLTDIAGSTGAGDESLADLLPLASVDAEVLVSNVLTDTDKISFSVDRVGTPVLVRASYFPNWTVSGADGPYRVAPNFMVVVPTDTDVELSYSRTTVDKVAILLSVLGLVGLIALGLLGKRKLARPVSA